MHPKPRAEGAHKKEPAKQVQKNREHVSRFLYPKREKVSVWELSDDFGTAHGPFLLVGETVVSRQFIGRIA